MTSAPRDVEAALNLRTFIDRLKSSRRCVTRTGTWRSARSPRSLGEKGIQFDNAKFGWLGSAGKATPTCMVMSRTGVTDLKGLMSASPPVNFGSAGTLTRDTPLILRDFVGAKVNVVRGYTGTAQIRAAVRRKEVDGYCSSYESVRIQATELLEGKDGDRLIPFLTSGDKDEPALKNVPLFADHIKNADERTAYEAWLAPYKFFRAYVTPPGIPRDRLEALHTAFKNPRRPGVPGRVQEDRHRDIIPVGSGYPGPCETGLLHRTRSRGAAEAVGRGAIGL